ncbi:MAG: hypothetical protein ABIG61_14775 [Planctomycetota bacterium]
MCGPDYELMGELDEKEIEIEEKLSSLLKEWKEYVCVLDKTKRTTADWRKLFCSYVEEQLADFEKRGRLNNLLEE